MIQFDFSSRCYSCGACRAVCPVGAFSLDGQLHPVINTARCISCGKCDRICPALAEPVSCCKLSDAESMALVNRDAETVAQSSSGGFFLPLALSVLSRGGVVCGCIFGPATTMPRHVVTDDLNTVRQMMGSKYVQSDPSGVYDALEQALKDGRPVLFTGVPCQTAAIRRVLGDPENLLTMAVVCHGSIARPIWEGYLAQERRQHGEIVSAAMRDKSRGWLDYGLRFTFADGSEHVTYRKSDGYLLSAFTKGMLLRRRCLSSPQKGDRIAADLLAGDGWQMDRRFPAFRDRNGISAVLLLSPKGKAAFEQIRDRFDLEPVDASVLIDANPRIVAPDHAHVRGKALQKALARHPERTQELLAHFVRPTLFNRLTDKLDQLAHKGR